VDRRGSARSAAQLAVLFALGVVAGVWTVLAPWVVGFPSGRSGSWSSSTWSAVWVGGIVVSVSAVGLVTALGLALSAALRPQPARPSDGTGR
jgi:hypothetical protein